jgi:hypothetical protein
LRDLIEEILKFGVKIKKFKSKDYVENGAQMQGANYSLNQGLNYKTFKTSRAKTQKIIKHQSGAVCGYVVHLLQRTSTATITPAINGWKKQIVLWL